jgi:transaldolase / glucose-6-phosphate isomerase
MSTPATTENPLLALIGAGQSVWYDYLRRSLITSGELERLITDDGLRGMTSNPAIFEKAITGSSDYDDQLAELRAAGGGDPKDLFEQLALRDIAAAAEVFGPVFEATDGRDGFVSIEVSPTLAHDTDQTIAEAERLWRALDRPNVMVKVPATQAGIPAIRALTARGVNVNITLLFGVPVYEQVAEAYIAGLEAHADDGGEVANVASVASFFVSRIDAAVDPLFEPHGEAGRALAGKIAIANAKIAYERYQQIFAGERWQALASQGARTQRLLWASTSTKDPAYPDVYYVEALIGPDTIDTVPPATFDAFRDHGRVRPTLTEGADDAHRTLADLAELGISLDEVTDRVLAEGVEKFDDAFGKLLDAVARATATEERRIAGMPELQLPEELRSAVEAIISDWQAGEKAGRLWRGDPGLWTGADEGRWLGWLGVADDEREHFERLEHVAADAREGGFEHAVLLGMGGSSLAPEVLAVTFGPQAGRPQIRVLDSTDPAEIQALEAGIDVERTLFIVSSKSGTTLEPNIFERYFFARVAQALGRERAGERFIAITDPGSKLEDLARRERFRAVAHGVKSIGGRYSALSNFGLVPGAIAGVDVRALLARAHEMAHACASCVPAHDNPGLVLGAVIGAAAVAGHDKLTIVASRRIRPLGAWLEQLLAESTGKDGHGVVPVDREPLGPPDVYGDDRLFAYLRLASDPDAGQDRAVDALARAGQPVAKIEVGDLTGLGGQFFQWEFATSVAGAVIGINPFDQPDVEASKVATRKLTDEFEQRGELPPETPILEADGVAVFADERNAAALDGASLEQYLAAHLGRAGAGDYVALLAYIAMTPDHDQRLEEIRRLLRDRLRVATCVGFGPRFLHSTGQAYKGGPESGVFLQITCDDPADIPVPGHRYTFGIVKAAQARGDFEVLAERGRRALRLHLGAGVDAGLVVVRDAVERALA